MSTWLNRGASGGLAGASIELKEGQNSPRCLQPPMICSRSMRVDEAGPSHNLINSGRQPTKLSAHAQQTQWLSMRFLHRFRRTCRATASRPTNSPAWANTSPCARNPPDTQQRHCRDEQLGLRERWVGHQLRFDSELFVHPPHHDQHLQRQRHVACCQGAGIHHPVSSVRQPGMREAHAMEGFERKLL